MRANAIAVPSSTTKGYDAPMPGTTSWYWPGVWKVEKSASRTFWYCAGVNGNPVSTRGVSVPWNAVVPSARSTSEKVVAATVSSPRVPR